MARPHKPGLDYFPQDTDIFRDRKIRKLISTFGARGFMVHEYIKALIYSDKGYFIHNDTHFAFDVADSLGNGITEAAVKEIIAGCVNIGLFDKGLFDRSGILTSAGIQRRYLFAKRNGVIADEMRVTAEETEVNAETIPERKVKNSKEKESKEPPAHEFSKIDSSVKKIEPVSFDAEAALNENRIWMETVCISQQLKSVEECKSWLKKFVDEQKAMENFKGRPLSDLKKHFVSWLKIEKSKPNNAASFTHAKEKTKLNLQKNIGAKAILKRSYNVPGVQEEEGSIYNEQGEIIAVDEGNYIILYKNGDRRTFPNESIRIIAA